MRREAGCCIYTIQTRYVTSLPIQSFPAWQDRRTELRCHPQNVLFTFCALNELFFIGLYLLSFSSPILSPSLLAPTHDASMMGHSVQPGSPAHASLRSIFPDPYSAGALEMARANKMDSFWPWVITVVSAPVMLAKQGMNVVQLVKASRWLAEGDLEARREQGLGMKKKG